MADSEKMLRLVGCLQAAETVLNSVLKELDGDRHSFDLIVIARDVVGKAVVKIWGNAPELPAPTPASPTDG